ncbi:MAG: RHS repeat protein, partial [Alphaproteobacteria bacterium]|nr:RHS repeat protein [Alphaproteobacteria bacterium]
DVDISTVRPVPQAGADLATWRVYDTANRLVQVIDGKGDTTVFTYDGMSNLVQSKSYANKLTGIVTAPSAITLPTADPTNDRVTRNFYDNDGRLTATLDGMGYLTQTLFDAAGAKTDVIAYCTQITDPTTKSQGTLSQLIAAVGTNIKDLHTRYVYEDRGLLKYQIDTTLRPCEYNYNAAGNLLNKIEYAGSITAPSTWTAANVATQIGIAGLTANVQNRKSWTVYDNAGRVAYTIDGTGGVVQFNYDANGYVRKQVRFAAFDPISSDQSYSVMNTWAQTHAADTDNRIDWTFYDSLHRVSYNVNTLGYVTEHRYDNLNKETLTIQYAGAYAVDDNTSTGTLATQIGNTIPATAIQTKMTYDNDGRLSDTYNGINVRTHYAYNALGQLTDRTEAYGETLARTTHYAYDAAGRLSDTTDVLGTVTHVDYNAFGQVADTIRGYNVPAVTTETDDTYDTDGRLTAETKAAHSLVNTLTTFAYDAFNVTSKVDGANDSSVATTTAYTYDNFGRLATETKAYGTGAASTTSYQYNAFSQVSFRTDGANDNTNATTTAFLYDLNGRLTDETRANGTSDASTTHYAYNAFGDVSDLTKAYGTTIATTTHNLYDTIGRLATSTRANGKTEQVTTAYVYDAFNNVTYRTDASNTAATTTTYNVYDLANRLTASTRAYGTGAALQTVYSYDDLNRLTDKTVANGLPAASTTHYEYWADDHVKYQTDANGTGDATQSYFQYDALGRMTYRTDANGTGDATMTRFDYDALSRSTKEYQAYGTGVERDTTYLYDVLSRLTDKTVASNVTADASTTHYTYDAGSRMTAETQGYGSSDATTTHYDYDALDRVTTKKVAYATGDESVTTYVYDFASRLKIETDAPGLSEQSITNYTYDALDEMLTRVQGTNSTTWTYDGLSEVKSMVRAINSTTSTETDYSYDGQGNVILATQDSTAATPRSTWSFYNALGKKTLEIDAARYWTSYGYDVRGDLTSVTRGFTPFNGTITPGVAPTVTLNASEDATTTFTVDKLGRITAVTDAMNNTESYALNDLGERTTVTNKLGGVTTNTYNALGQLTSESTQVVYHNSDNVQHTATVLNTYQYDARGNRKQMVEASGTSDA